VTTALKDNCRGTDVHRDSVQFFSGKVKKIQRRHYDALASPAFAAVQSLTLPFIDQGA